MTSRGFLPAAALLAMVVASPAVRAESRSEEEVTPLSLARHAEAAAVVAAPVPPSPGRLEVEEGLLGPVMRGDVLTLSVAPEREDLRLPAEGRALVFLRKRGEGWEAVGGAVGLFPLPPGPEGEATAALLRGALAQVGGGREATNRGLLRDLLIGAVLRGTGKVRPGAALDLWREPGLLEGTTAEDAAALRGAFASLGNGKREKGHLARVLGRLRAPGTGEALAEAAASEGGGWLKREIGEAVGDLGDGGAVKALAARAANPQAKVRAAVAGALGWTGRPEAREGLEPLVRDGDAGVRAEAAVGLGRLRVAEAAGTLVKRLGAEGDGRVRRALAWALAQCDAEEAWAALRAAAAEDADPSFRAFAAETLANPRREFVR